MNFYVIKASTKYIKCEIEMMNQLQPLSKLSDYDFIVSDQMKDKARVFVSHLIDTNPIQSHWTVRVVFKQQSRNQKSPTN